MALIIHFIGVFMIGGALISAGVHVTDSRYWLVFGGVIIIMLVQYIK